jgi:hypothetical protein
MIVAQTFDGIIGGTEEFRDLPKEEIERMRRIWNIAMAQSKNWVADDRDLPMSVAFANGAQVAIEWTTQHKREPIGIGGAMLQAVQVPFLRISA